MLARLTSVTWIPDLGLPDWCSSKKWIADVKREDGNGGSGIGKDRDGAIDQAFKLSASWGPQEEERGPREQGELF